MSDSLQALCRLDDLPEGGARGFRIFVAGGEEAVFLVRKHGSVVAYLNSCPHTGGPLDWVPDQFLDLDGDLIQCATHDALFRIEDGVCVAGPCKGKRLHPVPVVIVGDTVCADISAHFRA